MSIQTVTSSNMASSSNNEGVVVKRFIKFLAHRLHPLPKCKLPRGFIENPPIPLSNRATISRNESSYNVKIEHGGGNDDDENDVFFTEGWVHFVFREYLECTDTLIFSCKNTRRVLRQTIHFRCKVFDRYNCAKFDGTDCNRFYVILFDPTSPRMKIPPQFHARCNAQIGRDAKLRVAYQVSDVTIENGLHQDYEDDELYFTDGWLQFVQAYNLQENDMITFKLDLDRCTVNPDTPRFKCRFFDTSTCCEKDTPLLLG